MGKKQGIFWGLTAFQRLLKAATCLPSGLWVAPLPKPLLKQGRGGATLFGATSGNSPFLPQGEDRTRCCSALEARLAREPALQVLAIEGTAAFQGDSFKTLANTAEALNTGSGRARLTGYKFY